MLETQWIDISCSKCKYAESVRFISLKLEETFICHNCKITIKLIDQTASVHVTASEINNAVKSLKDTLKGL